jgi:hypothetical protein
MGEISVLISSILMIFSLIASVISAFFNAYLFCGVCYLRKKKGVYERGLYILTLPFGSSFMHF